METILRGKTSTVRVNPGLPTVIIGEHINPTGRKKLAEALSAGAPSLVRELAQAQVEASNVSFGMPERGLLNQVFLAMAIACGVNCPISHPAHLCDTILAADVLLGRDEYGMCHIKACRAKRS